MAMAVGEALGTPVDFVLYNNPGLLADAAAKDEWDIGLIGAEPQRASVIAFSQPYAAIEATYLVPEGSAIESISDVDREGVRVAVSRRAAYCLWLEANLRSATLMQTAEPGLELSRALFMDERCDVLAGLRPWLLTQQAEHLSGSRVLDGSFTTVQQAISVPRSRADGGASMWLERFVGEAKASGLVEELIGRHGVGGRLAVAE